MRGRLMIFFGWWLTVFALMVVQKPLFIAVEPAYAWSDFSQAGNVVFAGLTMDLAMSAYLLVPVALWLIASVWVTGRVMNLILKGWFWVVALFIAAVAVTDAVLYPYWGFRLDATPIFYFTTSPASALASMAWWAEVLLVLVIGVFTWLIWLLQCWVTRLCGQGDLTHGKQRVLTTAVLAILTGLLIIPIRGGVTVSTMAPARAFFCGDMHLNHAAVNPGFSLMHSLAHVDRLGSQFRYYDDELANAIVNEFMSRPTAMADSACVALTLHRPDIYLIILESFSAHLMPSMGGQDWAPRLDSIAGTGVLFTDFYAESFRTDRALASILSGYPAMPTTSVLKYSKKFDKLPSLAAELKEAGYSTSYFYGGDLDFVNQRSYLLATGYDQLVSDGDFALDLRLSKWGVPDQYVYDRALAYKSDKPSFRVVQTSSSHEPFDVPFAKYADERRNAFAYADSCLGTFVDALHTAGKWQNSLVVIVADHWGIHPADLKDRRARHHIPLVLTGGALSGAPARIATVGSQSAIAPTLLAMLGLPYGHFLHPRNLFDASQRQYAWTTETEWHQMLGAPDSVSDAFVQTVYADLNAR